MMPPAPEKIAIGLASRARMLISPFPLLSQCQPHDQCHVQHSDSPVRGRENNYRRSASACIILVESLSGRRKGKQRRRDMAASVMASVSLKPAPFTAQRSGARGLPSLARTSTSFKVEASGGKKIKTDKPYGTGGGMNLRGGLDASGRKPKGKGVYQFVDKYGANVDGYSPIYDTNDWSPSGDVYVGGTTGLAIWAVTLAGLLAGGALLVYNTSALVQ